MLRCGQEPTACEVAALGDRVQGREAASKEASDTRSDRGSPSDESVAQRLASSAGELLTALCLLAVAVSMVWVATGYGVEARRLPIVVGVPLVGMALLNLLILSKEVLWPTPQADSTPLKPQVPGPSGGGDDDKAEARARLASLEAGEGADEDAMLPQEQGFALPWILLALAIVVAMFYLFGLVITAIVYPAAFMLLVGKQSWPKTLLVVGGLVLMFYLFHALLNVRLYRGYLATEDIIPYVLPF
jgi:type IV secretory pathway VirB2 component (pilin)